MWYIDIKHGQLEWWVMTSDTFADYSRFGYGFSDKVGTGVYRWNEESHSVWVF